MVGFKFSLYAAPGAPLPPDSLYTMCGLLLSQGGEFAFLLFSFATQNRVIAPELASLLIVVVVLTMAMPCLLHFVL